MNRIKAAVIGLGRIGLMYDTDPKRTAVASHAVAYETTSDIDFVAAADVRPEQEHILRDKAPFAKFYTDSHLMLEQCPVDIVSICTPPLNHLEMMQHILHTSRPKIIFCEKPIVNSTDEVSVLQILLAEHDCLLIPNLSRRWNSGMIGVRQLISQNDYGPLQKIHIRFTRGIYNTGSHVFDLIRWFAGEFTQVQAIAKIETSADSEGDPSFTFLFQTNSGVTGFAEAFDDNQYYLFEIDLYFQQGKIEIRDSGDKVHYFKVGIHPLFSGFKSLHLERGEEGLLSDSSIVNAVAHMVRVIRDGEHPACGLEDGVYPLFVADALLRSAATGQSERVVTSI